MSEDDDRMSIPIWPSFRRTVTDVANDLAPRKNKVKNQEWMKDYISWIREGKQIK